MHVFDSSHREASFIGHDKDTLFSILLVYFRHFDSLVVFENLGAAIRILSLY